MIDDAVIQPERNPDRQLPPAGIMVAHPDDLADVCRAAEIPAQKAGKLMMSRLHVGSGASAGICAVGPFIGAPYAVILLETLIARGVGQIIFFGWCGALSPEVKIGDVVIPTSAFCADGTSLHYQDSGEEISRPADELRRQLRKKCRKKELAVHEGPVWTTDAVFRETPDKISAFQKRQALCVDMETAALFAVGKFRQMSVAAIFAVSDELSTLKWQPGFRQERFLRVRKVICRIIADVIQTSMGNGS